MSDNQISETKKLNTETIQLPSGHLVEIRGMKTREIDILASKKAMKDGEGINDIAKSCIISSSDGFNYDTALQGDRFTITINIRRLTYGQNYEFKLPCPRCEENTMYNCDLTTLKMTMLDGRPTTGLQFTLPKANQKIIYHLPTGLDEKEMLKQSKRNPDSMMTIAMMVYTDKVEGLEFKNQDYFENLDASDVLAFQDELDSTNCGIDSTLELTCSLACGHEFEVDLPITKDFFLPRKTKKK